VKTVGRLLPTASGFAAVQLLVILLVAAALFVFPLLVVNPYLLHLMILLFLSVAMGESWNVIGGYCGQYSVGHAAYFGVGAYAALMLLQYKHVAPWWGVWVAIAAALVISLLIGTICFRLRGPYFVLASIAVAEIIRLVVLNWKQFTNGAEGILLVDIPPLRVGATVVTDWLSKTPFYYLGLILALATLLVNYLVQHSKLGYFLQAIREDQDAAHSLGINLSFYKNVALAISALFTAVSGVYYGLYIGFIDPASVLGLDLSVQMVLICIIGGIGTNFGPVVGALVLVPLSEALRANLLSKFLFSLGVVKETSRVGGFLKENLAHAHVLIYGILVVVVILFMPDGVLGFGRKLIAQRSRPFSAKPTSLVGGLNGSA